jgi:hypothetical protein
LLKVAKDSPVGGSYLYGGSSESMENAMKAACHELNGAGRYWSEVSPFLIVPMQSIVDFKGKFQDALCF